MAKFYVYRLFDIPEVTLYVGKGSGGRLRAQITKRGCKGEILERFSSEKAAYLREIELISQLQPTENRNKGGYGGLAGAGGRLYPWEVDMEIEGSRRHTARRLLRFDLGAYLGPSEVEEIRRVANGPRC